MINKAMDLLRPAYYSCKDFFDFQGAKILKKNIKLYDRYLDKRVFLLFTGESLERINITKLKNEYTCGMPFIFLHEEVRDVNLTFYMSVVSNRSFYLNSVWPKPCFGLPGDERMKAYYEEIDKSLKDETILILHSDNYSPIEANKFLKNKTKYFVKGEKDLHIVEEQYKIAADLTKRRISGGGIAFFSTLIMMYMGFKEIYLCGAGYTYEPVYELHFYDNLVFPISMGRERAENEARRIMDDRNKRHGAILEYYGLFEKNNFYRAVCVQRKDRDPLKDRYRILNNYAKSQGVKIYNIVPDGFESPVYEKITWQEVESKVLSANSKGSSL